MFSKITGWFGPLVGIAIAAIILGLFVGLSITDSNWRILGFVLALAAFVGFTALGIANEKKSLNDKAGR